MTTIRARAVAAVLCLATMALSACGGGGDGGSGGGGEGTVPTVPTDVRVSISTAPIALGVERAGAGGGFWLPGSATGNLARLTNARIYLVIEDPNGIFDTTAALGLPTPQGEMGLVLSTRTMNTVGSFTGQFTARVCLDPACRAELQGSPARVPYTVRVVPEVLVSPSTLQLNATFGEPAFTRSITFQTSGQLGGMGWTHPVNFGEPTPFTLDNLAPPGDGHSATYTVTFFPMAPGRYSHTLDLLVQAVADGVTYDFAKRIEIQYDTADNPAVDYVFSTPSLDVTSTPNVSPQANFWPLVRPGVTMTWRGWNT